MRAKAATYHEYLSRIEDAVKVRNPRLAIPRLSQILHDVRKAITARPPYLSESEYKILIGLLAKVTDTLRNNPSADFEALINSYTGKHQRARVASLSAVRTVVDRDIRRDTMKLNIGGVIDRARYRLGDPNVYLNKAFNDLEAIVQETSAYQKRITPKLGNLSKTAPHLSEKHKKQVNAAVTAIRLAANDILTTTTGVLEEIDSLIDKNSRARANN